jgi:hypothetical protein
VGALSDVEHGGAPHAAALHPRAPFCICPIVHRERSALSDRFTCLTARSALPAGGLSLSCSRVQVRAWRARSDRAAFYLVHDLLDGVDAPAALHSFTEAAIDLAHPQPLSLRKRGTKLLVSEHVARTDDHQLCPNSHIGPRPKKRTERGHRSIPPRAL